MDNVEKFVNMTLKASMGYFEEDRCWLSMRCQDLPLSKAWIRKMINVDDILILIERSAKGGNTIESTCESQQGMAMLIPMPTHRACFIGTCEQGYVTATFRWISKDALGSITNLKHPDTGKCPDLEWIEQLPCFPKGLAIAEIPQELSRKQCDQWMDERGLKGMDQPIPYPISKGKVSNDPNLWIIK